MRSSWEGVLMAVALSIATPGAVDAAELTPVLLTLEGELPFLSAVAEAYGGPDLDLGSGHIP